MLFFLIFVIVLLLVIFAGLIYFFVARKKQFQDIDQLELRKVKLMNRPVLETIERVKSLNASGQAADSYLKWRSDWDNLHANEIPKLEELFFLAEELIERFRFSGADKMKFEIREKIEELESKVEQIFSESKSLMATASQNELSIRELLENFDELKKSIIIHNHSYGNAITALEKEIDEYVNDVPKVREHLENGDYFIANETLFGIKKKYKDVFEKSQEIPKILIECNNTIPDSLRQLEESFSYMERQGFSLQHFEIEDVIAKLNKKLKTCSGLLKKANSTEAAEIVNSVNAEIDQICLNLEEEGTARQHVIEKIPVIEEYFTNIESTRNELQVEVEKLTANFKLPDAVEIGLEQYEEKIVDLKDKWIHTQFLNSEKRTPFSKLKADMVEIETALDEMLKSLKEYQKALEALSKDEQEAFNKIDELRQLHKSINNTIHTANFPGVPTSYTLLSDDAKSAVEVVDARLKDKPINMVNIMSLLNDAIGKLMVLKETTEGLIEDMNYAERVIQYGNRYRQSHPDITIKLAQAEEKFRLFSFSEALEIATLAIETVEPNFFKNIRLASDNEISGNELDSIEEETQL